MTTHPAYADGYAAGQAAATRELMPRLVAAEFRASCAHRGITAEHAEQRFKYLRDDAFLTADGTGVDIDALEAHLDRSTGSTRPPITNTTDSEDNAS